MNPAGSPRRPAGGPAADPVTVRIPRGNEAPSPHPGIGLRPLRQGRPDGSAPRFEALDRFSLRTRIAILAALAATFAVVLVSAAAFFTVRANILDTLDANLYSGRPPPRGATWSIRGC